MDVGTYVTVLNPSGVSACMWKEGAGMQSGAGSEHDSHSHPPESQMCLLFASVVPGAQYGGKGGRENPERKKEGPRKVKHKLCKAMLLCLHMSPGTNRVFGPQFLPSQLTSRQKQSLIPASC